MRDFAIGLVLGILFGAILLWLTSCGPSTGTNPGQQTPPPSSDPAWAGVSSVIQRDCGGCHNGSQPPTFNSPSAFKTDKVKSDIESGRMPLGKTLDATDKAVLLAYLNS